MLVTAALSALVLFFALLLVTAAMAKLAMGRGFPSTLRAQGLPDRYAVPVAQGVILTELAVSVGLVSALDLRLSFLALTVLMTLFLGYRLRLLHRGSSGGCGCFSAHQPAAPATSDAVAAGVYLLGGVAGLVLSGQATDYASSSLRWLVTGVVVGAACGLGRGVLATRRHRTLAQ